MGVRLLLLIVAATVGYFYGWQSASTVLLGGVAWLLIDMATSLRKLQKGLDIQTKLTSEFAPPSMERLYHIQKSIESVATDVNSLHEISKSIESIRWDVMSLTPNDVSASLPTTCKVCGTRDVEYIHKGTLLCAHCAVEQSNLS